MPPPAKKAKTGHTLYGHTPDDKRFLASGRMGYCQTQSYLAVTEKIAATILEHGFRPRTNKYIRCSFHHHPREAVVKMMEAAERTHDEGLIEEAKNVVVLSVFGIDGSLLDPYKGQIKPAAGADKAVIPADNLRGGEDAPIIHRGETDHKSAPCPLCQKKIDAPDAFNRSKVGVARYREGAFACTPCTKPECVEKMKARQERLSKGETRKLYHQTNIHYAELIHNSGGRMIRGSAGEASAGIYFAETVRETEWKWEDKGPRRGEGSVVLECEVDVGNVKTVDMKNQKLDFGSLIREGYDSVKLLRGMCTTGPGKGKPSGDEVVVFSWDQVRVMREVQKDPVPGEPLK